jgi:putative ABC transport system permease protein
MLYAINEFSFDAFHKNAANTYLVLMVMENQTQKYWRVHLCPDAAGGPAMKQDLPGVEIMFVIFSHTRHHKTQ